jgi:uncharacterized iron-regulated membrane protein
MKRFRTALFWLHLLCGVTAGVVILIMSATGVVLAFKPQIQEWIERDVRYVAPQHAATQRLAAQQLLSAVKSAKPGASVYTLTLARDPAAAVIVSLGRDGTVFVNPYTGGIVGEGSARTTRFFQVMTDLHRYLGASGEYRPTGRSFTGASNLAFLVLAVTGLFIWWPKQFTLQHLKPIVWFRRRLGGRARDFNWHNTIGFWCAIPIVIMTVSGAVISYQWATNLTYRLTGSPVPPARGAAERVPEGQPAPPVMPAELDRIWARAEQQVSTWSQLVMRFPNRPDGPVTVTITDGANWNAFARSNLTLDAASGEVMRWQPYEESSLGQKVRGWLRFAHTGELGGVTGQFIAGVGCLGGVFLVCTGLMLAFRRLWNWSLWKRADAAYVRDQIVRGVRL